MEPVGIFWECTLMRHPLLPKAGWGKWRFDSDLKGNKWKLLQIQVLSMLV
jgi:hypothetical protein